ncbi:MAG: N-(5'-phosphoribosyl)anthranilate isomerase [Candidatus Syntrophoarchaeum sp. GoM_oil]|nr:MAG: N-(5'-phosphoribosyl)anthranilate isomerase [Candidatus Syntrophoarchaeum sp. GoM_oil]
MTFVKICGIKTEKDLKIVLGSGVDAVGFIVEVPVATPRKIDRRTASALVESVPEGVLAVSVLMPGSVDEAVAILDLVKPDAVQIHNEMDPGALRELKERTGLSLIKVIGVSEGMSLDAVLSEVDALSGLADFILLDTKTSGQSGGTGKVHDWGISAEICRRSPIPVILAGGLNHTNVEDAIRSVKPYGVDTASGVETESIKDPDKVKKFVDAAKRSSS